MPQYCEIGAAQSVIIKIIHGVFQGSILGPLVFIIFMNDVIVLSNNNILIVIYADDTTICIKLSGNLVSDQEMVDNKMLEISDFMNANSLAFNFKKTKLVNCSVRKREDPGVVLNLNNEVIHPENAARLLGLYVTRDMTHHYFLNEMENNLLSQVRSRFNAFKLLSKLTTTTVHTTL